MSGARLVAYEQPVEQRAKKLISFYKYPSKKRLKTHHQTHIPRHKCNNGVSSLGFLALSCLFLAALSFVFKTFPVFGAGGSNKFPPGPKPWPIIGNLNQLLIGTVPHQTYHKLSQKYGPILQLKIGTVPVVIASSAETAKLFLKTHDHVFAFRPKLAAGKYTGRNYTSILWSPYGPHHLQWRKICQSELFAFKRLESYEYIRVEEIRAFISSLYASLGEPLVLKTNSIVSPSAL
ncbi:hypothetical protein FNV43_RR13308 [Rhamnella rubrinervis]|uniref:Cytochrome P450 n=1 Tax=Rhamnella rubrinervis TaxID=2594499 RepID=A0A8K0MF61_9ROSA|nr:hypothetical protein FNV43_RR13308 [Rhamnella rubrinervis]